MNYCLVSTIQQFGNFIIRNKLWMQPNCVPSFLYISFWTPEKPSKLYTPHLVPHTARILNRMVTVKCECLHVICTHTHTRATQPVIFERLTHTWQADRRATRWPKKWEANASSGRRRVIGEGCTCTHLARCGGCVVWGEVGWRSCAHINTHTWRSAAQRQLFYIVVANGRGGATRVCVISCNGLISAPARIRLNNTLCRHDSPHGGRHK